MSKRVKYNIAVIIITLIAVAGIVCATGILIFGDLGAAVFETKVMLGIEERPITDYERGKTYAIYVSDYDSPYLNIQCPGALNFNSGIPEKNDFIRDERLFDEGVFKSTLNSDGKAIEEAIGIFMNAYRDSVLYNYLIGTGKLSVTEYDAEVQSVVDRVKLPDWNKGDFSVQESKEDNYIGQFFGNVRAYNGAIPKELMNDVDFDREYEYLSDYHIEYVTATPATMLGDPDGTDDLGALQKACIVYLRYADKGVEDTRFSDYTILSMAKADGTWSVIEAVPAITGMNTVVWMKSELAEGDVIGVDIQDLECPTNTIIMTPRRDYSWNNVYTYSCVFRPDFVEHTYYPVCELYDGIVEISQKFEDTSELEGAAETEEAMTEGAAGQLPEEGQETPEENAEPTSGGEVQPGGAVEGMPETEEAMTEGAVGQQQTEDAADGEDSTNESLEKSEQ